MSEFRQFLDERRRSRRRRPIAVTAESDARLAVARVRAEGCSGIRHIQIRDFQILTDLGPDCAGFDLGPTPFELQLGVLGSCLTQCFLAHAAARGVALERIEVEVTGRIDPLAGTPGRDRGAAAIHDVGYTLHVTSSAPVEEIAALRESVERSSPILNLLVQPQLIRGTIVHDFGSAPDATTTN